MRQTTAAGRPRPGRAASRAAPKPARTACVVAVAESSGRATIAAVPVGPDPERGRRGCGSLRLAMTGPWCAVPSGAVQSATTRLRSPAPTRSRGRRPAESGPACGPPSPSPHAAPRAVPATDRCRASWAAPADERADHRGDRRRISSRAASATQASTRSVARRSGLRRQRQSPLIARTVRTPFPLRDNSPAEPFTHGPGEERAKSPAPRASHELLTKAQRAGPRPGSRDARGLFDGAAPSCAVIPRILTGSPTRIVPRDRGTRFCPKTSLPPKRRCRPRVRRGSLPRSAVGLVGGGHHAPPARLGHPEGDVADRDARPVVLGPGGGARHDHVRPEPVHGQRALGRRDRPARSGS